MEAWILYTGTAARLPAGGLAATAEHSTNHSRRSVPSTRLVPLNSSIKGEDFVAVVGGLNYRTIEVVVNKRAGQASRVGRVLPVLAEHRTLAEKVAPRERSQGVGIADALGDRGARHIRHHGMIVVGRTVVSLVISDVATVELIAWGRPRPGADLIMVAVDPWAS